MKQYDLKDYARIPEHISQAYIRAAYTVEEEPMNKRKLSLALIAAIVLALVAVTALAAALLSGKEFAEDVLIPKAQESQSEHWTEEEIIELLRIAEENGLSLSETMQAQLLDRGGYAKEELMRLFVKLELGDQPSAWSIEDQVWYAQMMIDIGFVTEPAATLPEEGEATEAEMLAVVTARIHQSDPEAALDDETVYKRHTTYQWTYADGDDETPEKQWYVAYEPLDLYHAQYRFTLDTKANILWEWVEPSAANREDVLTPESLRYRFVQLHGNFYDWEMAVWVEFQDMLQQSAAAHGFARDETLEMLSQSVFALPEANSLAKDEAIGSAVASIQAQEGLAPSALARDKAFAVYLMDEGAPVWKATVPAAADGDYLVEIDAQTGETNNIRFVPYGASSIARSYMPESAFQASMKNRQPQPGELRFDNRRYTAVEPLSDGGFLLAGNAWAPNDIMRAWAARIGPDGKTLWEVFCDEGANFTQATAMSDGSFLLAMEPRKSDAFFSLTVLALSANGETLSNPVTLKEEGWAYKGKDCLVIAKYYGGSGTSDSSLMAVNASGEILWEHTYDALRGAGYHVHTAADGYLLSGSNRESSDDPNSTIWGMMARLDDAGSLLWISLMEDHPQTGISSYAEASDGGMYGAGTYYPYGEYDEKNPRNKSNFVARFDAEGNVLWCRNYPELDAKKVVFFDMLPVPDDGVLLFARGNENRWFFVHLDKDGEVQAQWSAQFAVKDFYPGNIFTAGEQSYLVYTSRPEYEGIWGPVNTYAMPIVWPET